MPVVRLHHLLLLLLIALTGCGSGNHLLGQWSDETGKFIQTIRPDNTYSFDITAGESHTNVSGSWTYEGNTLHFTPKTVSVVGGEHAKEQRELMYKSAMKPTNQTLEWQDNDRYIAHVEEGGMAQMHRKK